MQSRLYCFGRAGYMHSFSVSASVYPLEGGVSAFVRGSFEIRAGDAEETVLQAVESLVQGLRTRVGDLYHPEHRVQRNVVGADVAEVTLLTDGAGAGISQIVVGSI